MADPAPPVSTGIQRIDRHVRISRMAQGAGRKTECNIGVGGRNSTWRAKANGGHERHYLAITGVSAVSKRTVVRGLLSTRDVVARANPGKSWLEQIDDGGGSPDEPHQWKTNRGEDEWKGECQENSQRHIGEQGQGPVSPRRLRPGDVDDGGCRHSLSLLSGGAELSDRARSVRDATTASAARQTVTVRWP